MDYYFMEKMMFKSTKFISFYTTAVIMYSMARNFTPEPVKDFLYTTFYSFFQQFLDKFFSNFSNQMTIVVNAQKGLINNQVYDSAQTYLPTKINPNVRRMHASKSEQQKTISLSIGAYEEIIDSYKNVQLKWLCIESKRDEKDNSTVEERFFELTFKKPHVDIVVNEYLPFVVEKAKEIRDSEKELKLCRWNRDNIRYGDSWLDGDRGWDKVNFNHPVTFDKLAMDPNLKKDIIEDLDRFVRRKEYYKKVGKPWKRGYLLYGPPGTGKSSLVAAMANYLRFNVYDLELASLLSDSELRNVLLCIRNRSIVVIEDIDCSSQVQNRNAELKSDSDEPDKNSKKKGQQVSFTLSGLLNFIDGLWSTCGNERIIIFTTNHKEKLDPALLRPGRMDMHIHMGYCTPEGFNVLVYNYLGIQDHPKLIEIKGLIQEVNISPAELAEHLMRNENVDLALEGVLSLLKNKAVT